LAHNGTICFYPCAGRDIALPRRLLRNKVDQIICCDTDPRYNNFLDKEKNKKEDSPECHFVKGDARNVVIDLERIDILFHRNDSWGEGGSGVPVLSYHFLPLVIERMPDKGGLIYTDGSNSLQSWFERISRPNGVERCGCHFEPIEVINDIRPLPIWVISVQKS